MSENKISAVILDWVGTSIDYGCFAPVKVFMDVFERKQVPITEQEARGPMGLLNLIIFVLL